MTICVCLLCGLGVAAAALAGPLEPPKEGGFVLPDGTLQIVGYSDMEGLIGRIDDLFVRRHPGFKFKYVPANDRGAIYSMEFGNSVFCPVATEFSGSHAYSILAKGAPRTGNPFGIRIAHSSLAPEAKISPAAIIVNRANPIDTLTSSQVARIFVTGLRAPDLTHWAQVGVTGPLGAAEIRPYGLPWTDYYPSEDPEFGDFMFVKKMGNEGRENGGQPAPGYVSLPAYADVVARVKSDPLAIGITNLNHVTADVKLIAVQATVWSRPSRGSRGDIQDGIYPYDRYLYIYVRRVPGEPLEPFLREYLNLALSPEGQAAIASEAHGYIPLSATEAAEERQKLQ